MSDNHVQSVQEWGLLANGSSGHWYIDIDESGAGDEWHMQIESPTIDLRFVLQDLRVVPELLGYLRAGIMADRPARRVNKGGIAVGLLGTLAVSFFQDDEIATRWFIIIKGKADAVVRLTLDAADAGMLVDALAQVMEDLPQ
jgi:hypothetical protein